MAKYMSGLTTKEVCELECEEARKLLKYVDEGTVNAITDMIEEAYYQLAESYASARALEKVFIEAYGAESFGKLQKDYLSYRMAERANECWGEEEDE